MKTAELPAAKKRQGLTVPGSLTVTSAATQTESPIAEQQITDVSELDEGNDENDSAWETEGEDYQDEDISAISNNATINNDTIDNEADWESDRGVNEEGSQERDGEAGDNADGEVGNDDGLVTVKLPSGRERRVSKLDAILLAWVNA